MLFLCFLSFLSFFQLVTEKDEKTCFHAETNEFNQQTETEHPFAGQNTQQKGVYQH